MKQLSRLYRSTTTTMVVAIIIMLTATRTVSTAAKVAVNGESKPKASSSSISMQVMPGLKDVLKLFWLGSPSSMMMNSGDDDAKESRTEKARGRQPLLIIGAGFGRTSTSSYMAALKQLGLKTYQMSDGVAGTPGHIDMWCDYIQAVQSSTSSSSLGKNDPLALAALDRIIDDMAQHGFHSTASMPPCLVYDHLLKRYPKALVILTVRSDGDGRAWAKSMQTTAIKTVFLLHRVPFRWSSRLVKFRTLVKFLFEEIGAPFIITDDTSSHHGLEPPSTEALASAYERWVEQVQETIPSDQLLVFPAKQGWGPLCQFLEKLNDTAISEACAEASKSSPYPHINDSAFIKRIHTAMTTIAFLVEYSPLFLVLLFLVILGGWKRWRQRGRRRLVVRLAAAAGGGGDNHHGKDA